MNRRTSKLLEQYANVLGRDRRALTIWWKGLPAPEKSKWRDKIQRVVDAAALSRAQARKELSYGTNRKDPRGQAADPTP